MNTLDAHLSQVSLNGTINLATNGFYQFFNKFRFMFYCVSPYETMHSDINLVPRYVVEMFPFFIFMAFVENIIRFFTGKKLLRPNDSIASVFMGICQECLRINVRSIEIIVYCFIYENFRLATLPWNSLWTWYICFISIDFGFYWAHRIAHEIHFIWAIHQNHHSGEDFTLVTGLRQAVLQPFTAWITYVPLALCIPPPIFLAHLQLGELYMFWLHNEVVTSLGPLEYIFNSPSHHRVHHGRNPKYIDKNYGGVLIIWDRLLGTFQAEDPDEPVAYGLVHSPQSYNPFYLQLHSFYFMFKRMYDIKGIKNKLLVPFMGPGWEPGKPRLGLISDIPEVKYPIEYWDPNIPALHTVYAIIHFCLIIFFYNELNTRHTLISQFYVTVGIIALLFSITSTGFILEGKKFAPIVEIVRCLLFFAVEQYLLPIANTINEIGPYRQTVIYSIRSIFLSSAIFWSLIIGYKGAKTVIQHIKKFDFDLIRKKIKLA